MNAECFGSKKLEFSDGWHSTMSYC